MVTHSYGGNRGSNGFTTGANSLGDIVQSQGLSKHNLKFQEHILEEEQITIYWQVVKRRPSMETVEFHPQQYLDLSLIPLTLKAQGEKRGRKHPKFAVHVIDPVGEPTLPAIPALSRLEARHMALIIWRVLNEQSDYAPSTITADLINMDIIPVELRREPTGNRNHKFRTKTTWDKKDRETA